MTLCCAHRGASGLAPENTLAAIRRAIACGADLVEIDVQQTADDRLAVFHDTELGRTSNGYGPLWRRTLPELQALDAGAWFAPEFAGEAIPSLDEVLALCRGRVGVNIEMKMHGQERGIVELVIGVVHDTNSGDHCLVTSFDHEAALAVKRRAPGLRAGLIIGPGPVPADVFASPADVLSIERGHARESFLARACGAGKSVHVWTVDDPARMRELVAAGVEAVITNFPDRFPRGSTEG
jgi:glycerophosphoryl diester phosphodiesterase